MILPLDAMDGAALINQWAELGLRGQVGVCGQGGFEGSEAFLKLTGPNAEGLIDATMFSPFLKPPPNERYTNLINGFRSLYGYLPDKYAVRAYDSIKILAQAIERAQSIDGNSVREALLKTSYTSAIGENLTFDQDHQLHRVELIVQIKNGDHVLIYQKLM
jgi:branched-chain amino acid transport system substrate-binding protein